LFKKDLLVFSVFGIFSRVFVGIIFLFHR